MAGQTGSRPDHGLSKRKLVEQGWKARIRSVVAVVVVVVVFVVVVVDFVQEKKYEVEKYSNVDPLI